MVVGEKSHKETRLSNNSSRGQNSGKKWNRDVTEIRSGDVHLPPFFTDYSTRSGQETQTESSKAERSFPWCLFLVVVSLVVVIGLVLGLVFGCSSDEDSSTSSPSAQSLGANNLGNTSEVSNFSANSFPGTPPPNQLLAYATFMCFREACMASGSPENGVTGNQIRDPHRNCDRSNPNNQCNSGYWYNYCHTRSGFDALNRLVWQYNPETWHRQSNSHEWRSVSASGRPGGEIPGGATLSSYRFSCSTVNTKKCTAYDGGYNRTVGFGYCNGHTTSGSDSFGCPSAHSSDPAVRWMNAADEENGICLYRDERSGEVTLRPKDDRYPYEAVEAVPEQRPTEDTGKKSQNFLQKAELSTEFPEQPTEFEGPPANQNTTHPAFMCMREACLALGIPRGLGVTGREIGDPHSSCPSNNPYFQCDKLYWNEYCSADKARDLNELVSEFNPETYHRSPGSDWKNETHIPAGADMDTYMFSCSTIDTQKCMVYDGLANDALVYCNKHTPDAQATPDAPYPGCPSYDQWETVPDVLNGVCLYKQGTKASVRPTTRVLS